MEDNPDTKEDTEIVPRDPPTPAPEEATTTSPENMVAIPSPAATLVVAIPVKRDAITNSSLVRSMTKEEFVNIEEIRKKQVSRVHVYTHELREKRK